MLMDGHAEAQEVTVGAKLAFVGLTMARGATQPTAATVWLSPCEHSSKSRDM